MRHGKEKESFRIQSNCSCNVSQCYFKFANVPFSHKAVPVNVWGNHSRGSFSLCKFPEVRKPKLIQIHPVLYWGNYSSSGAEENSPSKHKSNSVKFHCINGAFFWFCPLMSNVVIIVLFAQMPTVILLIPFGRQLVHCKKPEKKNLLAPRQKGLHQPRIDLGGNLKVF